MTTTTHCDRYLAQDGFRELLLLSAAAGSRLLVDRRERDGGVIDRCRAPEMVADRHAVESEVLRQSGRFHEWWDPAPAQRVEGREVNAKTRHRAGRLALRVTLPRPASVAAAPEPRPLTAGR